jgi:hypothetical protein
MNKPSFKPAIELGVIQLAISVAFLVIAYVVDISLMTNFSFGIFILLSQAIVYGISPFRVRKLNNGFITFREAFTAVIISMLIASVAYVLVVFVLFNVIDPAAGESLKELTIEKTVETFNSFGLDQAKIDEAVDELKNTDQFSLLSLLKNLVFSIIGVSIYGLIIAAIAKNAPDSIED